MKIGDHYEIPLVCEDDWRKLAKVCTIEEEHVLEMVHSTARLLPDAISDASGLALGEGLDRKFVAPLAQQLSEHARERIRSLTRTTGARRPKRPQATRS